MSVLIKHMAMPKGCIYANDKDQTEYCPLLNHDDVPFCQYIENEPEIAIGIDERPVYCPISDVPEPCQDTVSRQAAIDALDEIRHALWEIDIPSPTVPEYVEHHEQVQSVWRLLDKKQKELYVLPSAQPEPRWIPCSEKLPEEHESIWAKAKGTDRWSEAMWEKQSDEVIVTELFEDGTTRTDTACTHDGEWYVKAKLVKRKIIAWMPLPEPYKERRTDAV